MAYVVAVTDSPAGDDLSIEREVLAGMRVEPVRAPDRASLATALRDVDAILCTHVPIDATVIGGLRRCRVIARYGTGLDSIDRAAAAGADIAVVGVANYCTAEVADHTLALLLCWNRRILDYHRFVVDGRWNERPDANGDWGCGPPATLGEQVLGLIGFGHIGQAVARRARAFDMRVLAFSRRPDPARAAELGVEFASRESLLARSDYVSLHVPLTGETRGMIDGHAIALMKPGAVLINTARGGLVDEAALVAALRSGHLGGALLDVFREAPLPLDHPLRDLPNVILTPHVGFYAEGVTARLRRLAAEAVRGYLTWR